MSSGNSVVDDFDSHERLLNSIDTPYSFTVYYRGKGRSGYSTNYEYVVGTAQDKDEARDLIAEDILEQHDGNADKKDYFIEPNY